MVALFLYKAVFYMDMQIKSKRFKSGGYNNDHRRIEKAS